MTDQSEGPDDDDSAEIQSSLSHEFRKEPGEGPIMAWVTESRGIRQTQWIQFDDPNIEDPSACESIDTHALLYTAANRHLDAVGEMDFFDVMDFAERDSKAGYPSPEEFSRHLRMWVASLKARKGSLSVDTIAARFIQSQDRLFLFFNGNREMQEAAMAYADAWHWLHMELFGEHERAAYAEIAERAADSAQQLAAKTIAGRMEGPKAKKRYAALRNAIIATEYGNYRQAEPNENRRTSSKSAAAGILDNVNATLSRKNLGTLELSTLERRLRKIINLDD